MKLKYIFLLTIGGFLLYSCEPEIDEYSYSSGTADFSKYVSLGNSHTSGYADRALYKESQQSSYPAILANQFKKVGGGEFTQPLMPNDRGVGLTLTPAGPYFNGKLVVGFSTDCLGATSLAPVPADPNASQGELAADLAPIPGTYNNMGVPGAKSFHLLAPGYGTLNPYFGRFASSPATSVLGDAAAQQPTFFSLWIGTSDMLGFATGGGMGDTITGQGSFGFFMNSILQAITAGGAKGVIANIPDIASSPFFTTVPPNGYVLEQWQADTLNQFLEPLGFQYQAGPNYFIVEDANSPLGFRQMTDGEYLLLTVPQDSLKCKFWGGYDVNAPSALEMPQPIPSQYVLDAQEVAAITGAIDGYNQTIAMLADQYDLALVDINTFMADAAAGVAFDGETISTAFITGNAYSTDGLHMTPKGNAMVANLFIEAINKKFGSTIPMVSTTHYRANIIP